jgi:hypothetical protein
MELSENWFHFFFRLDRRTIKDSSKSDHVRFKYCLQKISTHFFSLLDVTMSSWNLPYLCDRSRMIFILHIKRNYISIGEKIFKNDSARIKILETLSTQLFEKMQKSYCIRKKNSRICLMIFSDLQSETTRS